MRATPLTFAFPLAALLALPAASRAGQNVTAIPRLASANLEQKPFATPQIRIESGAPVPIAVQDELDRAVPFPTAQLRGVRYHGPASCKVDSAELTSPLQASGRAAIRVSGVANDGQPCKAFASVDVLVTAETWVASQPIREGAPLEGAVQRVRREVKPGEPPLTELPAGAVTNRSLSAGQRLEASMIKIPGLTPGASIRVRVEAGALALEQQGRVVPCDSRANGMTCALVGQNKKVEGVALDGVLHVTEVTP